MDQDERKQLTTNLVLLFISLGLSILVVYHIYSLVSVKPASPPAREETDDYALSFYNHSGNPISERNGQLTMLIDPFTLYRNYPNQECRSYTINEHGFRDGYTSDQPQDTAVLLGSSAAFGEPLDDNNKTFASIISRQNDKYDLLNCAVAGYLSGQELANMVHYIDDYHPDLYIVFDGWNELFIPLEFEQVWTAGYGPIGFNNTFFITEERLAAYFEETKPEGMELPSFEKVGAPLTETEHYQAILEEYTSNIGKMSAFAKARGAGFLLIFQPELGNKQAKSREEEQILKVWGKPREYLKKDVPKKYRELIDDAIEFCKDQQIECFAINDAPEFNENPATLFYDPVHPNELGHEIIAKIINRKIEENF